MRKHPISPGPALIDGKGAPGDRFRKKSMSLKSNLSALALAMIVIPCSSTSWAIDRSEYVSSVVEILRTHAMLLEELSSGERFKYSDNLVRHANALDNAFGLLGPMEWHAAQSARLSSQTDQAEGSLDEAGFEELADASQKALSDLVRAAHYSMEEHDPEGMMTAIENMKSSCNSCHRLLPPSAVPDVWGNLQRD